VDASPESERGVRPVSDAKVGDRSEQMQGHGRHLARVTVAVTYRQAADYHVRIANRLYFVDVVAFDY